MIEMFRYGYSGDLILVTWLWFQIIFGFRTESVEIGSPTSTFPSLQHWKISGACDSPSCYLGNHPHRGVYLPSSSQFPFGPNTNKNSLIIASWKPWISYRRFARGARGYLETWRDFPGSTFHEPYMSKKTGKNRAVDGAPPFSLQITCTVLAWATFWRTASEFRVEHACFNDISFAAYRSDSVLSPMIATWSVTSIHGLWTMFRTNEANLCILHLLVTRSLLAP